MARGQVNFRHLRRTDSPFSRRVEALMDKLGKCLPARGTSSNLVSRVVAAALAMPSQTNGTSTYKSCDMDLKAMFGLSLAKLQNVDRGTLDVAKSTIAADLFRLGSEAVRPNTEGKAGMTQLELMETKTREALEKAEEKKRTGDDALIASTNGNGGKKRAKVIRGGSNATEVQRSSVPFSSAGENSGGSQSKYSLC